MHPEDGDPLFAVGQVEDDVAVEAAGAQQRGIEHVGPICRCQHDDRFAAGEAVELREDLVQCLFALVMAASQARAPGAADAVELVHENDAGGGFLGGVEKTADARGADADENLDELGAGDGEEGHSRLAGQGLGEQGLARAWRAHQQHAPRYLGAQPAKSFRTLEELHQLGHFTLGIFLAGDVGKGDFGHFPLARRGLEEGLQVSRAAEPSAERAGRSLEDKVKETEEEEPGQYGDDQSDQGAPGGFLLDLQADILLFE